MLRNLSAEEFAARLAEIQKLSVCEDCDVLRGANLCAMKYFGSGKSGLFQKNLIDLMTTHVDLGCDPCPVDRLMKALSKDRFSAVAAIF